MCTRCGEEDSKATTPELKQSNSSSKSKVNSELWEALKQARASQNITVKSRKRLLAFLNGVTELNSSELQGLVGHILQREHPTGNETSQKIILSFMKAFLHISYVHVFC